MFKLKLPKLSTKISTLDTLLLQLGHAYDALVEYKRNLEAKEEALATRITAIQDDIAAVEAVLADVNLPE